MRLYFLLPEWDVPDHRGCAVRNGIFLGRTEPCHQGSRAWHGGCWGEPSVPDPDLTRPWAVLLNHRSIRRLQKFCFVLHVRGPLLKYSRPLNYTGLKCAGPLTHGAFSVHTVSLPSPWVLHPQIRNSIFDPQMESIVTLFPMRNLNTRRFGIYRGSWNQLLVGAEGQLWLSFRGARSYVRIFSSADGRHPEPLRCPGPLSVNSG